MKRKFLLKVVSAAAILASQSTSASIDTKTTESIDTKTTEISKLDSLIMENSRASTLMMMRAHASHSSHSSHGSHGSHSSHSSGW